MNYFQQVKAFRTLQRTRQDLQSPAVALWYALLGVSNDLGHPPAFPVALSALALDAGLSVSGVKRARNTLAQKGYIQWRQRRGRACAEYQLLDIALSYPIALAASQEPHAVPHAAPQSVLLPGPFPAPNPLQEGEEEQQAANPLPAPAGEGGFEDFWSSFPKKAGKEAARRAYLRLGPDGALRARLLEAVAAQARGDQWQREGGRYIPLPANWLTQRRWEDEPPAPASDYPPNPHAASGRASGRRVIEQMYTQRDYDPSEGNGPSPEDILEARKL